MKTSCQPSLLTLVLCAAPLLLRAQTSEVPDWAWPGSATHQQVPPPAGFHRSTRTFDKPIGIFTGQSDIGGPLLPGSANYDAATRCYTLNSASYNIWYFRDEFRYVWKKISGDVSLAADVTFPNPDGYGDRKAVLVIRQDLDDDSKEIMAALHGAGLIHLALRPEKGADIKEAHRFENSGRPAGGAATRIGIEKHGDSFVLFVSLNGEPVHPVGQPVELRLDGPFYVGIGFCSHVPDKSDTAVLSNVVLENAAGVWVPAPRLIAADVRQAKGPLNTMFNLCVGAGRANEGLRADWQRQLACVRRECGFRYVRFHGLLCDDMGVYSEDKEGHPVYNWQYIDELYDSLLAIGVRPFVELGFMPAALASGTQTIFWWKGNVTPPKDYQKWENLIRALVTHWTGRYGEAEVATWYFEVWNEPNLAGFWIGDKQGKTDAEFEPIARAEYFKLYAVTARAVKTVSPRYRVGGPATAGNAWIPETIEFCARNAAPLDFISTHHYAVTAGYLDVNGSAGTVLSPDREAMYREIRRSRAQIAASARPDLELHYTEWSTSYTPFDPIHDSYHSAAFILDKIKGTGSAAQSMSYWTFTDIFEEAGPRTTPFHGGFGLINYQGINKPAFFAYQFLHRLGETELVSSDPAAWVCTDREGGVQTLFWDFTITNPGPSVINQEFYRRDLSAATKGTTTLRLTGLPAGDYALEVFRVGYRVNDAYAACRDIGAPAQLTREQVALLKARSDGAPVEQTAVTIGADGVFQREFPLRENDVVLARLRRR